MRARLLPLDGGSPVEIDRDVTVVGRKDSCDLRLDHKSVSKLHCVIVRTDGLLLVRDLGSTNGTRVNGTRIRRAALLPNDQVNIASVRFKVYLGPDEVDINAHTQRIDAADVAKLRTSRANGTDKADDDDDSEVAPAEAPVQTNVHPDVYPEEPGK